MSTELQVNETEYSLPIDQIVRDENNLREAMWGDKVPEKYRTQYGELSNSIELRQLSKGRGAIQAIVVRQAVDDEGNIIPDLYYLVDGMQRHSIYQKLNEKHPDKGFDKIPAIIDNSIKTDLDVMITQLTANIIGVETSKAQEQALVLRLSELGGDEFNSGKKIGKAFGKTEAWVSQVLRLKNLSELCDAAFRNEELPPTTAQVFSRLPEEIQDEYLKEYLAADKSDRQPIVVRMQELIETRKKDKTATTVGEVFNARSRSQLKDLYDAMVADPEHFAHQFNAIQMMEYVGQLDEQSKAERENKDLKSKLDKDVKAAEKELEKIAAQQAKLEALNAKIAEGKEKLAETSA